MPQWELPASLLSDFSPLPCLLSRFSPPLLPPSFPFSPNHEEGILQWLSSVSDLVNSPLKDDSGCIQTLPTPSPRQAHTPPNRPALHSLQLQFGNYTYLETFFFFFLFRAAPAAYKTSRARGRIEATAAGLHRSHSHSNVGSEPRL